MNRKPPLWVLAWLAPFALAIAILSSVSYVTGEQWLNPEWFLWRNNQKSITDPNIAADSLQKTDGNKYLASAQAGVDYIAEEIDPRGIHADGSTTCTGQIGLHQGAMLPSGKALKFGTQTDSPPRCIGFGSSLRCFAGYDPTPNPQNGIILDGGVSGSGPAGTDIAGRITIKNTLEVAHGVPALQVGEIDNDFFCFDENHTPVFSSGAGHACGTFEFDRQIWLDYLEGPALLKVDATEGVVAAVPDVDFLKSTPTPVATATPGVKTAQATFDADDLSDGVLTFEHRLGQQFVKCVVYNGSDLQIVPDEVEAYDENTVKIYLYAFDVGTNNDWHITCEG